MNEGSSGGYVDLMPKPRNGLNLWKSSSRARSTTKRMDPAFENELANMMKPVELKVYPS